MATLPDIKRSNPPSCCDDAEDGDTLYLVYRSVWSWKACAACGESMTHLVDAVTSFVLLITSAPYWNRNDQYIQFSMLRPNCFWSAFVSFVAMSIIVSHVQFGSSHDPGGYATLAASNSFLL